jgi:hypothetical protein
MNSITFELTITGLDAGTQPDDEECENVCECVKDALGFPDDLEVTAKVIRREAKAAAS